MWPEKKSSNRRRSQGGSPMKFWRAKTACVVAGGGVGRRAFLCVSATVAGCRNGRRRHGDCGCGFRQWPTLTRWWVLKIGRVKRRRWVRFKGREWKREARGEE